MTSQSSRDGKERSKDLCLGLCESRDGLEGFFGAAVNLSTAEMFSPINFRIFIFSTDFSYVPPNHSSERSLYFLL